MSSSDPSPTDAAQHQTTPTALDLGLYARSDAGPRITTIEIVALVVSLAWIAAVVVLGFGQPSAAEESWSILSIMAVVLPLALIWVAAMAARTARALRQEAARLQGSIDAMRAAYVEQQQRASMEMKPELAQKLDDLVAAQADTETRLATFTTN